MVRTVLYLFLAIIAITLLRAVIGFLARGAGDLLGGATQAQPKPASPGGELRRDPVCGTYVSATSAFRKGDEVFCSAECRDKHSA